MDPYQKPSRLMPLQLYSPYQHAGQFRRLISRDQERLRTKSFKNTLDSFAKTNQKAENIMSFARLYSQPAVVFTSMHERQILGRVRKPKVLPPLSMTHFDHKFAKSIDQDKAYSLHLSRNSSTSELSEAKHSEIQGVVISDLKHQDIVEDTKIEEADEVHESELIITKPHNHEPRIVTVQDANRKSGTSLEESGNSKTKNIEHDIGKEHESVEEKGVDVITIEIRESRESPDFKINDENQIHAHPSIPMIKIPDEGLLHDGEEDKSLEILSPMLIPNIEIIEEHAEVVTIGENTSLVHEIPGSILKINSVSIKIAEVDHELKLPLVLLKHVIFGTELDIIVNVTSSIFAGNKLTFMKKENYLSSFAQIQANYNHLVLVPDFQRTFLLLKPSAVKRKVIGQTIKKLERVGLVMKACKMIKPNKQIVEEFYKDYKEDNAYSQIVDSLVEGPAVLMCWEGPFAVSIVRKNIKSAEDKPTIESQIRTSIHSAEDEKQAEKELGI